MDKIWIVITIIVIVLSVLGVAIPLTIHFIKKRAKQQADEKYTKALVDESILTEKLKQQQDIVNSIENVASNTFDETSGNQETVMNQLAKSKKELEQLKQNLVVAVQTTNTLKNQKQAEENNINASTAFNRSAADAKFVENAQQKINQDVVMSLQDATDELENQALDLDEYRKTLQKEAQELATGVSSPTINIPDIPDDVKPSVRTVWLSAINHVATSDDQDLAIKQLSEIYRVTEQDANELISAAKREKNPSCEQITRVFFDNKWTCPPGWTDTGRQWGDVDGEIQCTRGSCPTLNPNVCDYKTRIMKDGKAVCPTGYTDTGRNDKFQCKVGPCSDLPPPVPEPTPEPAPVPRPTPEPAPVPRPTPGPAPVPRPTPSPRPSACPQFQTRDSKGQCVCDPRQGVTWDGKSCVCDMKNGWNWDGKKCVKGACPQFQTRDSKGQCVCDPRQGVTWDGKGCVCDMKNGWNWDGKKCVKSGGGGGGGVSIKKNLGKFVMTWYSFDDNTPPYSNVGSTGKYLTPFISVAVPFRLLKKNGGPLNYGDTLYLKFLDGRTMPNGQKHNGIVRLDDFCGDYGDDGYCYQSVKGGKYPNVDLYIGDRRAAGQGCNGGGPAGSGQELTDLSIASGPVGSWGGKSKGPGRCGDIQTAERQGCGFIKWKHTEGWWNSTCNQVNRYNGP
ncbi:hypothetical protein FK949_gp243 [Paramecium bursaria Chlorella virus NYs1]|uniref:DUF5874 domain-containing protein n=1 Tax=Paramecium bursaria Chlorella virus NYs1 TaxID=83442 RepID=M1I3N6_9PHYC|nr:hypothetical protein FK949_gp243 [Paramecium bursaria Chlorella virus NYs1]AGE55066.1 hypothetical protein PBCVMA1D_781R [Paramecium bursaria Chlorella virus MA1D]AGE58882.1 hypothetical protein PBCVNYs1_788R [Paramecium bursaria Chlorella virus NYs1]